MSDRVANIVTALEDFPNLANRALVMLLQNKENLDVIESWIKKNAMVDIRFTHLAKKAGIKTPE